MKNVFMKTEKILNFKPMAILASAIAVISFSTCANAVSEEWKITSPATLRKTGKWLVVSYNKSKDKSFLLRPQKPIKLPEKLTRIKLWYANLLGQTNISMLIEDASGAKHIIPMNRDSRISPPAVGWDRNRREDWSLWTKTETIWLGLPGKKTLKERLTPEGIKEVEKLLWPKPWKLYAIRLSRGRQHWGSSRLDRKAIKEGKGRIIVGDLKFETGNSFDAANYSQIVERLRWTRNAPMKLFLDDLIKPAGKRKYSGKLVYEIKVRKGYQGPVVWQRNGEGTLDRFKPLQLMEQAIELPLLPPGKYFIQTFARSDNGKYSETRLYQWFIGEGPKKELKPIAENLVVETGQKDNVYPSSSTKATLNLKHVNPKKTNLYSLYIYDFTGKDIFKKKFRAGRLKPVTIPVEEGCDYFVTLKAYDNSRPRKILDVALLHFGVANAPKPQRAIPKMPNIDQLLKGKNEPHVEYWTRRQASLTYPWVSTIDMKDMEAWMKQVKGFGWNILAIRTIWPDMEMLPGVTRFKQFDELMKLARKNGQKVIFGCSIWGDRGEAVWADWTPARNQHGDFPTKTWPAAAYDPVSKSCKEKFWENLARRYNSNPDMVGYHILGASLSGRVKPEELRRGYSALTQQAYKQWLKQQGMKAEPLTPPLTLPLLRLSKLPPDLSDGWLHVTEFLTDTNVSTVKDYLDAIRKVDKQRPVIVDRKPFPWGAEALVPMLKADGNAALKNEGSPRFADVMLRTMSVQDGVPYLGELHRHVPTSRALADVIYFWEALWANHALWIQRWRYSQYMEQWVSGTDKLRNSVPEVLDFMKQTQNNWNKFISVPYDVPEVLLFGSRTSDFVGGQRRGFFEDMDGYRSFAALFRRHQVPVFAGSEYTDWIKPDKFKLVFVKGEILTPKAFKKLNAWAKAGTKLVFIGDVGKYITGSFKEQTDLYTRLKHLPNVRHIDAPSPMDLPDVLPWARPSAFDPQKIDALLAWAGVKRPASVKTASHPGFEVATRRTADGKQVFVGVMRSWYGFYRNNIEKRDVLRKKFGMAKGVVTVDLPNGTWQVKKFHRDKKNIGTFKVTNGTLVFPTDEAEAAEVMLYEITRK